MGKSNIKSNGSVRKVRRKIEGSKKRIRDVVVCIMHDGKIGDGEREERRHGEGVWRERVGKGKKKYDWSVIKVRRKVE